MDWAFRRLATSFDVVWKVGDLSQTKFARATRYVGIGACALALSTSAAAADPLSDNIINDSGRLESIVVTAQKEEQPENTIGMSITAATGDTLEQHGIDSVADLPRLVSGLTLQQSAFNSTSFTLRGVGFFNSDLATPPAVTIYIDEAPLPYPAMAKLAAFDLQRVEVLKGPQGTLFGQNATGGAVNYITAKPTDSFESGFNADYGTFDRAVLGGFVSGPLNNELTARLSLQGQYGDPWQDSVTRAGDKLGKIRALQGRATLEWQPSPQLTSRLTFTFTYDGSDSLAAQLIQPAVQFPALSIPGLLSFPIVTRPRIADWTTLRSDTHTQFPYGSSTALYHTVWRNDFKLNDSAAVTSLTSYAYFWMSYGQDPSGTPYYIDDVIDRGGRVSSFFQELRAAGQVDGFSWLLGTNFAHDAIKDRPIEFFGDNDVAHLFENFDPQAFSDESMFKSHTSAMTYAVFGRLTYSLTEQLALEGGVRYNVDRRNYDSCSIAVTDHFASYWNLFRGGTQPLTEVGDCYVLNPANGFQPVDDVHNSLNQNSASWRTGINWQVHPDLLLYANISKGYKAGAVPVLAASTSAQFNPVPQESLLAYEAGYKAALFDHRAQFNAAAFYYDYHDKQLRGAELDRTFGPLEALVSIPQSHVEGAEAQLVVEPVERLTLDTSVTYLQTRIDRFVGYDALAHFGDQSGTPFPFSPKWQSVANVDYTFPVLPNINGFVGGSITYNSKTYSGVGALDTMRIDSFTLLDIRAGIEINSHYRLWVWGKNITDKYYWSDVFANGNAISRFPGQPATFGISVLGRF